MNQRRARRGQLLTRHETVFAGYRGRVFGTQLMRRRIDSLIDGGFGKVWVRVDAWNPVLRLYERFGFEVVRKTGNAYTMLKTLSS